MCLRTWHLHACGHATSTDTPCADKWQDTIDSCPRYGSEEDTEAGECERCESEKRKEAERRLEEEGEEEGRGGVKGGVRG